MFILSLRCVTIDVSGRSDTQCYHRGELARGEVVKGESGRYPSHFTHIVKLYTRSVRNYHRGELAWGEMVKSKPERYPCDFTHTVKVYTSFVLSYLPWT